MTFFLVGPVYPLRGGIAQYLGLLGRKLQDKGHTVKALSFRKQFPRFLFPGQTQLETSQDYIELDAQPVFIPWNPLSWRRTFWLAHRERPDALIFKYWMPFFAPGFAAVCALTRWFTSIRTIFILDNVIPHERRPGDRFLTRLAFRWVDGFIVQSEIVRRDLYHWFPRAKMRDVKYVLHPIYDCYSDVPLDRDEARQKLGLKPEGVVLLFFGLVRPYKGLDILLNALPRVISKLGNNVHLLVAGEFYEPEEKYRELVESLGLSDSVTIDNRYIPNEEVGVYFGAADLLVLPYRSATQSGVIQVANYFGLPVVSTHVGGLPEVVREGETGFLVPPNRPDLLTDTIISFFQEGKKETILGNLQEEKSKYSWDEMIRAIEDMAKPSKEFSMSKKK